MFTQNFISLCKEYTQDRQDVLDETIVDSKKFCKYNIEFLSYVLEFVYVKKKRLITNPVRFIAQ